jgi:hypothetical protein
MTKVKDKLNGYDEKENEKIVDITRIRNQIIQERDESLKIFKEREKELSDLDNAPFEKVKIEVALSPYSYHLLEKYWVCGKIKGKKRFI